MAGGITKTLVIDGKSVPMRASAAIVRDYRLKMGRDIIKDMVQLNKSVKAAEKDSSEENSSESVLSVDSLEMFENIAYLMAKRADPSIPDDPSEWLDEFNLFSIYEVLPQIVQLWGLNLEQQAVSKKFIAQQSGR